MVALASTRSNSPQQIEKPSIDLASPSVALPPIDRFPERVAQRAPQPSLNPAAPDKAVAGLEAALSKMGIEGKVTMEKGPNGPMIGVELSSKMKLTVDVGPGSSLGNLNENVLKIHGNGERAFLVKDKDGSVTAIFQKTDKRDEAIVMTKSGDIVSQPAEGRQGKMYAIQALKQAGLPGELLN